MINSDQIHVAMTKTCGLVATLACQSNTFYQNKRKYYTECVRAMKNFINKDYVDDRLSKIDMNKREFFHMILNVICWFPFSEENG